MKLTGSQIIVETLIEQGVDTIFGYPGGQVLNIYDALYCRKDAITHVLTAHEQGAAHAADGYSRASGKVGVCLATSGPGITNLVTGIATANFDSIPMVAITGNVSSAIVGSDGFQEMDAIGVTLPVTKHSFLVKDIKNLAPSIREAFKIAKSGRPGSVLIDVPKDVQLGTWEYTPKKPVEKKGPQTMDVSDLNKIVDMINGSKRPLVYCGGGVITAGCTNELISLIEKIDAYAIFSMMGLAAMPYNHDKYLGMSGMHGRFAATKAMSEADLIIGLGIRFADRATGNKPNFATDAKIIHLDIDESELGKNVRATLGLTGDIVHALNYITKNVPQKVNTDWISSVTVWKNKFKYVKTTDDVILPWEAISMVNDKTSADTIVATDVGQHQMWVAQHYNFKTPRTHLTSGGLGTMGYGMGAAIGGCMAKNKIRTVLFTGDGSFGMNLNEMATAVTNELPLIVVILNNGKLGMIRQWQTLFFDKRYIATDPMRKTDFVKLADAFGAIGLRANTKPQLKEALNKAFALNTPVVIDCVIPPEENVYPMIPPNGSINNMLLS